MLPILASLPLAVIIDLAIPSLLKWLIIILACIAIAYIAARAMGIAIPPWLVQMVVVVLVAAAAILAIGFLASL